MVIIIFARNAGKGARECALFRAALLEAIATDVGVRLW